MEKGPKALSAGIVSAENSGNSLHYTDNSSEQITFKADSGATERFINKGLILSNFEKCINKVIKSANKNRKADI